MEIAMEEILPWSLNSQYRKERTNIFSNRNGIHIHVTFIGGSVNNFECVLTQKRLSGQQSTFKLKKATILNFAHYPAAPAHFIRLSYSHILILTNLSFFENFFYFLSLLSAPSSWSFVNII